jgi:hypothetical protein
VISQPNPDGNIVDPASVHNVTVNLESTPTVPTAQYVFHAYFFIIMENSFCKTDCFEIHSNLDQSCDCHDNVSSCSDSNHCSSGLLQHAG